MSFEISLTKNQITTVDDDVYEWASKFKWYCTFQGYASRGNRKNIKFLHKEIMNASKGTTVDHINGNKLDNRKENLRLCSHMENIRYQKIHNRNTSGYKGVSWHKAGKKWHAKIAVNYKQIHLGLFKIKEDAARAYNKAAIKYFGEFAKLNEVN